MPDAEIAAVKITVLAIFLISIGKIAYAEPVYLDCSHSSGSETLRFSVKLDEETNKITHTNEDGSAFNTDGFFTADNISYQKISFIQGVKVVQKYTINRIDLSVQKQVSAGSVKFPDKMPMEVIGVTSGTCSIVTVDKKRKI